MGDEPRPTVESSRTEELQDVREQAKPKSVKELCKVGSKITMNTESTASHRGAFCGLTLLNHLLDEVRLRAQWHCQGPSDRQRASAAGLIARQREQMMDLIDEFFLNELPAPDPHLTDIARMIATIRTDRNVTAVDSQAASE